MEFVKTSNTRKIHMGPARFAIDLCDGSERGEYVDQDYILHTVKRPHRAINLMYCYYPNEETWPERASVAYANTGVTFAWGFPYEDYFPYTGGLKPTEDPEVFKQMRDIRRHGQDVLLTIVIDPLVSDEHLHAIGKDLSKFGRIKVRINHECTGDWFNFTKRAPYAELGKFFCRAAEIIRSEAPAAEIMCCIGAVTPGTAPKMEMEEEFACTLKAADLWSMDKYLSLHWGWPYDVAEEGGNSFARYSVHEVYDTLKTTFKRYRFLNDGQAKPMCMAELNSDGDVVGPYDQAEMLKEFVELMREDDERWLTGFTMYQFRDHGRLGLEIEDPNNIHVGIRQPIMDEYIRFINEPDFLPSMTDIASIDPANISEKLIWGGSEDAEGIAFDIDFSGNPSFVEAYFDDTNADLNCMLELNGQWFYKAPGIKCVDLMEAFFKEPLKDAKTLTLRMFFPPATGENDLTAEEGYKNSYTLVKSLPGIRVHYGPVAKRVIWTK